MRKSNAAAEITHMPAPMHEIHFDIFTYDGEPSNSARMTISSVESTLRL